MRLTFHGYFLRLTYAVNLKFQIFSLRIFLFLYCIFDDFAIFLKYFQYLRRNLYLIRKMLNNNIFAESNNPAFKYHQFENALILA